jgi:hypothetical protein
MKDDLEELLIVRSVVASLNAPVHAECHIDLIAALGVVLLTYPQEVRAV